MPLLAAVEAALAVPLPAAEPAPAAAEAAAAAAAANGPAGGRARGGERCGGRRLPGVHDVVGIRLWEQHGPRGTAHHRGDDQVHAGEDAEEEHGAAEEAVPVANRVLVPLNQQIIVACRQIVGTFSAQHGPLEAFQLLHVRWKDKGAVRTDGAGGQAVEVAASLAAVKARRPKLHTSSVQVAIGHRRNAESTLLLRPRIGETEGPGDVNESRVGEGQRGGVEFARAGLGRQHVEVACTLTQPVVLRERLRHRVRAHGEADDNGDEAEEAENDLRILLALVLVLEEVQIEGQQNHRNGNQGQVVAVGARLQKAGQDQDQKEPGNEHELPDVGTALGKLAVAAAAQHGVLRGKPVGWRPLHVSRGPQRRRWRVAAAAAAAAKRTVATTRHDGLHRLYGTEWTSA
mmetsp:Transcript_169886/g.539658  ORF Transcript_169886/g.539658 Transcript_169886/m.539658 type:complete len:402 (-) Transcript_169886:53-1258(-)